MRSVHIVLAALLSVAAAQCQSSSSAPSTPPAPSAPVPSASAAAQAAVAPPPSASAAATTPKGNASGVATEYRGTIGSGIAVVARLNRAGDAIRGTYFYEKTGVGLTLTGTAAGAHLVLDELVDTNKTGHIEADVGPDGSLIGVWTDAHGAKSFPVRLAPIPRAAAPSVALLFKRTIHATKPVAGKKTKEDVCKTHLEYAEVFGLAPDVEAKINAKLAPAAEAQMPEPCDHATGSSAAYRVAANESGVLSVRITDFLTDSQAAHASAGGSTVNVFLSTGADVKLFGDALKPKTEAVLDGAIASVVGDVATHEKWDADTRSAVLATLHPPTSWVLEKQGLRIYADALPPALASLSAEGFLVPRARLPRSSGPAAIWSK